MFTRLLPVLALTSVPALAQNIVPVAYESFDYTTNLGVGNGNGYAEFYMDYDRDWTNDRYASDSFVRVRLARACATTLAIDVGNSGGWAPGKNGHLHYKLLDERGAPMPLAVWMKRSGFPITFGVIEYQSGIRWPGALDFSPPGALTIVWSMRKLETKSIRCATFSSVGIGGKRLRGSDGSTTAISASTSAAHTLIWSC